MANAALSPSNTFDAYVQIDGVEGEAQDDKHKGWIELLSMSGGVSNPSTATVGSAGGASMGRSTHSDITLSAYVDKSTPKLWLFCSNGKHIAKAKIELCRAGGSQLKYLEINLEEVFISSVSFGAGGDGLPVVTFSLNFGKAEYIYTQQKRADGSGGGNVAAKYDLIAGK